MRSHTVAGERVTPGARSNVGRPRGRVGLVLGGGGTAGMAFHVGTLLAMQSDLGWDPRDADVIVGTSAGSVIAGLLRTGLSTDDLAAWATGAPAGPGGRAVRAVLDRMDDTGMRPVMPWRTGRCASSPSRYARLLGSVPLGLIDASTALRHLAEILPDGPVDGLYIAAVRALDARRVVFGRDRHAPLADTIAASCAIPGLFQPVRVGRRWYFDGGVHSATNADLLVGAGVDTAVILSPMTARDDTSRNLPDWPLRRLCRLQLARETSELMGAGLAVEVYQPSSRTLRAMGWNSLRRDRVPSIVTATFLGAFPGRSARGSVLAVPSHA